MTEWRLTGTYAEACTCAAACPCTMLSDPTEGSCTALVGWHIEQGHYGEVRLEGLNVAVGVHTPGNMAEKNWTAVLYVDDRATEQQRRALSDIFSGKAGGHPARLAEHIATVAAMEVVPIQFETNGRRGQLRVGLVGEAAWQPIEGQGGGSVTVEGHPLAVSPGHPATIGRATRARLNDHGLSFDASGRQAMVARFEYAGV
jgi:hypothetical protein